MNSRLFPCVLVSALAVSVPAGGQTSTHQLRGADVAVYNLAGIVHVEAGSGTDVQVEVTRRGPDASRLRIEAGPIRNRETLRVIYPEDRVVYRPANQRGWNDFRTSLRVNDDGTFDGNWDGSGSNRVEIRSDGSGLDASADLRIRVPRGKSLDLNLAVGEATVSNVEGNLRIDVHAASVTTSGTRGKLDLDTGSGEVRVTDARGEIFLDTGSGNVTLETINGPSLELDSGSGRVTAKGVEVEQLRLDTGSGRISLSDVKARELSLDSGSGSVDIDLSSDVDRMDVDAGSGSITIGVPPSLGAEVMIETGSGGIDVDVPITMTRSGRRSLEGRLGDGRGRMAIETGSGGVRIRASGR
jgi:lia operon protein LiaG